MAKEDFIKANPEVVRRYATAIGKAADWSNQNPGEVVKIGIERGKIDKDLAPWIYSADGKGDYSHLAWAPHGLQKTEDVAFWLELVERQGIVKPGRHKVEDLFTDQFNPFVAT